MDLNQAAWLIPATIARCDMDPSHGCQIDEVVLRLVLRILQGNVGRVFLILELNLPHALGLLFEPGNLDLRLLLLAPLRRAAAASRDSWRLVVAHGEQLRHDITMGLVEALPRGGRAYLEQPPSLKQLHQHCTSLGSIFLTHPTLPLTPRPLSRGTREINMQDVGL